MSQQCEATPQTQDPTEKALLEFFGREPKTSLEEKVFKIFQKHLYRVDIHSNYNSKNHLRLKEIYSYRYGGIWSLLAEDGTVIEHQEDVCYASLKRAKVPNLKKARYIFFPFPVDKEAKKYQSDPSPEYKKFVKETTGKEIKQKEYLSVAAQNLWAKKMKEMFKTHISHGKNKTTDRRGILLDLEDENLTPNQLLAVATIYRYTWEYADCVVPTLELAEEGCSFLLSLAVVSGFLYRVNSGHMLPFVPNQTYPHANKLRGSQYQYPGVFGTAFNLYWFLNLSRKDYQKIYIYSEESLKKIIGGLGGSGSNDPYRAYSPKFSWSLCDRVLYPERRSGPAKKYPREKLDMYRLFYPEIDEEIKKSPDNLDNLVSQAIGGKKA